MNNLSNSYVFFKNITFKSNQIKDVILPDEISYFVFVSYISPPEKIEINNNIGLYNILSQYASNYTNYLFSLVYNITRQNNTFQDLYNNCFSKNMDYNAYFIFPIYVASVFEANYNGEPIFIGVYQFGNATARLYNLTCGVDINNMINLTTCKIS
jgi:hypothetical protein